MHTLQYISTQMVSAVEIWIFIKSSTVVRINLYILHQTLWFWINMIVSCFNIFSPKPSISIIMAHHHQWLWHISGNSNLKFVLICYHALIWNKLGLHTRNLSKCMLLQTKNPLLYFQFTDRVHVRLVNIGHWFKPWLIHLFRILLCHMFCTVSIGS